VFFEDGYGEWKMHFDNPLHEFFVCEMWLAMVGDGVFQALAFA
jgi:hypothetical protein